MVESRETRIARRGITLTEVLISMGILAVGLLGVAALFPVGSAYMMKADVADNGSAIGQAVMSDIMTRGVVNPKAWYSFVPSAAGSSPAHAVINGVDSKYRNSNSAIRASYTRPFSEHLAASIAKPGANNASLSRLVGNAFVIDPLYIAAVTKGGADVNSVVGMVFPASAHTSHPRDGWSYYRAPQWASWRRETAGERVWPVRRVTLQGVDGWHLGLDAAANITRATDDLISDLPTRTDRPARQNFYTTTLANQLIPLTRQSTGDYSWIATVVPQSNEARNGLATNPSGFSYNVSVVVFHKRLLPRESATDASLIAGGNPQGQRYVTQNERIVEASVLTTGDNGGELLLRAVAEPDDLPANPYEGLRSGNWIMLCAPSPNSTPQEPNLFLNWYQVLTIERDGLLANQRRIVVRGPKWPFQPVNDPTDNTVLSNSLCVGIFRGAVAVHTKTMRLEGSGDGMALKGGNGVVVSKGIGAY